jgi:hypothetical protein
MQPSKKKELLDVLKGVYNFYGKDLSKFQIDVWVRACESFDVEQVSLACSTHLMDAEHGRFMPKPADIVRVLQGTNTDRALVAWGKVMDAAQRVGAYTSVCFDDGLIHAVIEDLGGWIELCRGDLDDLPFVQRRFCEAYRAYSNRPGVQFPTHLRGELEVANRTTGYQVEKPTLIGNPAAAQLVLAGGSDKPKTLITGPMQALRLPSPRSAA